MESNCVASNPGEKKWKSVEEDQITSQMSDVANVAIGIDLGTTFSCAAVYRKGKGPELIPNEYGERVFPSVVYYDPITGDALVGKNAVDEIPECPSNGLYDAKRILGRRFNDEYISKFINREELPFTIVEADDHQAAFLVKIAGKDVIKTPEEVSAEVLKYIKQFSKVYLGTEVTEAVISIPAYFSNAQRNATKKAAEMAGLKVLKLISEPTAAAVHYVSDKEKYNKTILVFDFGGGTLDVSIIKIIDKQFQVKAVYGKAFLGGRDIDTELLTYFLKKFPPSEALSRRHKKIYIRRLLIGCVEIKKKLTALNEAKFPISSYHGGEEDLRLTLLRSKFETLTNEIFERALEVLKLSLYDSGISKNEIDEVVLVGGSTKIPIIRDMVKSYFNNREVQTDIHPDEAVAAGASLQAAFLKCGLPELENYKVTEVTPLSLGTKSNGDLMNRFISRNTPLPFKITKRLETVGNDQTILEMEIFEGERKNTNYNNMLGKFQVNGLPRKRAGDVKVDVTFELDDNGILNLTAKETSKGICNNLSVTIGQFRLSEAKVERSVEEAIRNKHVDDTFEKFVLLLNQLNRVCCHILYDLDKISSSTDRETVKICCNKFLEFSKSLDFTEIEKLEAKFAVMKKSVEPILKDNCMIQIKF